MSEPSDADLIHRYRTIEEYCAAEQAALAERLKDYLEGMAAIKNEMLARLNARSPDTTQKANSKTEHGTAFRVRHVNAKVVDQVAFLSWCTTNWADGGADMCKVGCVTAGFSDGKGALHDFVMAHKDGNTEVFPPGLEIERSVTVNIRKA